MNDCLFTDTASLIISNFFSINQFRKCPHRLLDMLLKSVTVRSGLRILRLPSSLSIVISQTTHNFKSFWLRNSVKKPLQLNFRAAWAVSVRAHYRDRSFLIKLFLWFFPHIYLPTFNTSLPTDLSTDFWFSTMFIVRICYLETMFCIDSTHKMLSR